MFVAKKLLRLVRCDAGDEVANLDLGGSFATILQTEQFRVPDGGNGPRSVWLAYVRPEGRGQLARGLLTWSS